MILKFKKYELIMVLVFVIPAFTMQAQEKVNVITKTIKKEIKLNSKTLVINGEKSTINISAGDNEYVEVEIKLISKNTNKKQAETDIAIIKYEMIENANDYLIRNYFASERFGNVKSNLSVVYNIKVPKNSKLNITNIYGNVYLSNLNTFSKLKNSFGEIHISNIMGEMEINSYYSDTWAVDIDLKLICITDKSDIEMTNSSGNIQIKSNYGNINFSPGKNLKKLEIDSKRTTVGFESDVFNKYNFELSTSYSNIVLPEKWKKNIKKVNGEIQFNQINQANNPTIKITTSYCQITLKNK
jgi:hypothetical protein